MILKNQVEWALHCCAILAGLSEGQFLATKDLAELHGVPKEYLSKAMQALSTAGIVDTTLGPRGGYRLAKSPDDTTFLEIVEAIEGRKSTFICSEIRKNNPCRHADTCDTKPCAVARVMWDADQAWRNHLKSVSLSDLMVTLSKDVPKDIMKKTIDWVQERT